MHNAWIILGGHTDNLFLANVMYTDSLDAVQTWAMNHLMNIWTSWSFTPQLPNTTSVTYAIEEDDTEFRLVRRFKQVTPGYIYDSKHRVSEVLCTVRWLPFPQTDDAPDVRAQQPDDVVDETNYFVMRNLDQQTLCDVSQDVIKKLRTKQWWDVHEYTSVLRDTLLTLRPDVYHTISRQVRINKRIKVKAL